MRSLAAQWHAMRSCSATCEQRLPHVSRRRSGPRLAGCLLLHLLRVCAWTLTLTTNHLLVWCEHSWPGCEH
eukprot:215419-Chlamydomonas_euryale.AAC.2